MFFTGRWLGQKLLVIPFSKLALVYHHRGVPVEKELTLEENPVLSVSALEASDAQKAFRKAWMKGKAGNREQKAVCGNGISGKKNK